LKSFGLADRCTIIQRDGFKHQSDRPVDFVLSQEVLEHLEDPKRFVANLYGLVRSGGMGYITAAVTAGHSDHIYLFRSPDEVESLIRSVGFHVVDSTVEKAYDGKVKNLTPRIAGYLVRKD